MPLPIRHLGALGPAVPAVGLGLMSLSAAYGSAGDDEARFALLDRACDLGATFWDTADVYGDSEDLVGRWFARTGRRDEIFLATKFGNVVDPATGQRSVRSDAAYVREACEKSLGRLGIATIDLYYMHRTDGITPIETTVEAMLELQKEGKITHLGLSEVSARTLHRACARAPIAAVQLEYSASTLDIESPATPLLATARALGVAVVAYSPLGRGLLTGRWRSPADFARGDARPLFPRFAGENLERNGEVVEQFVEIARRKGCTPAQLALAWVLAQGEDVLPIPGTKTIANLEANLAAAHIRLTPAESAEIRAITQTTAIAGARYPPAFEKGCFADTPEL